MRAALLLAGLTFAQGLPPPVDILDKACKDDLCVLPKEQLQALLDIHDSHVVEIRELQRLLRISETVCRLERRV